MNSIDVEIVISEFIKFTFPRRYEVCKRYGEGSIEDLYKFCRFPNYEFVELLEDFKKHMEDK